MADTRAKLYYTTASKVEGDSPALSIADGQIIFTSDTQTVYLDMKGRRHEYTTIHVFKDDAERLAVLAPVRGFYFVENTGVLWRYSTAWVQITPDNLNPIIFGRLESFPAVGKEGQLYCADDAIYKWDTSEQAYVLIANKNIWIEL